MKDSKRASRPAEEFTALLRAAADGDLTARDRLLDRCQHVLARRVHDALAARYRYQRRLLVAISIAGVVEQVAVASLGRLLPLRHGSETALHDALSESIYEGVVAIAERGPGSRRRGDDARDGGRERCALKPSIAAALSHEVGVIHELVGQFSERRQRLLELRIIERMPHAEIADHLGYASGTSARQACCQTRARLAAMLRKQSVPDMDDSEEMLAG